MKKIILLTFLILSSNLFSQKNKATLIEEMNGFYNRGKIEKLEVLTNEVLSGKYGNIDNELKLTALSYSSNVYCREEYANTNPQRGYDKMIELIEYINKEAYNFENKDAYVKQLNDYLIEYLKKYPTTKTIEQEKKINSVASIDNKSSDSTSSTLENKVQSENNTTNTSDKTVTLTVSGTGKTLEEARLNALRSAIEQAFGTFISSKTEILNDNMVKDEIVSVTNGNIQKYDVISQVEVPNVGYAITLTTIVSIEKLTSFAESKGVIVEFKGGMFALNVKLQKIQEASELIAIKNICETSYNILKNSFNYSIVVRDPKVIGINNKYHEKDWYLADPSAEGNIYYGENDEANIYDYNYNEKYGTYIEQYSVNDFFVDFQVTLENNTNYINFKNFFEQSFKSISISKVDAENRKNLTNEGGVIEINEQKYYLRNTESIKILNKFVIKSNYIPYFFKIKSNLKDYPIVYKCRYYAKQTLNLFDTPRWIKGKNGQDINYFQFLEKIFTNNVMKSYNENIILTPNEINNSLVFNLNPRKYVINIREYLKLKEIETIDKFEIIPVDIESTINKEKERISKIKSIKILNAYGTYPQVYSDFFGRSYKYGNKFDLGNEVDDNGRYVELIEIKNKIALVKIYNAKFDRDSTDNNGYEFSFRRTFENDEPTKSLPGELFYIPTEWISDKPVKTNFSEN